MNNALILWPLLGAEYKLESEDLKAGYFCWFLKDREVQGRLKAVAGGMYWDYPQELLDRAKDLADQGLSCYDYSKLKVDEKDAILAQWANTTNCWNCGKVLHTSECPNGCDDGEEPDYEWMAEVASGR